MKGYIEFLGKVIIIPGEKEMEALSNGVLRTIRGEEEVLEYTGEPIIVGGKQNIVTRIIREYNLKDIIDEMLDTKVVMGTSAGAIMWGRQIESKEYFKERYNKSVDDIKDKDYGIVNFNIIPHYMRKGREQWNEDFLKRTLKDEKFPIYAINDNQMISYVDGEINLYK